MVGPDWIQIGTESGFLPAPVVIPNNPIVWITDPTLFAVGNVDYGTLMLGPAERADVILDFSAYAGQTLILYNDAPAPWPALDPLYDYYTGAPDLTENGGHWGTAPGFGPNTRTIMQIVVRDVAPAAPFDIAALEEAFVSTDTYEGVFARSQEPIIVGQSTYDSAYNMTFPTRWPYWGISRIQDNFLSFMTADGTLVDNFYMQPKAIQDEMGEAFDKEYGRMSGFLGLEVPRTAAGIQNFVLYPFMSPPVEIVKGQMSAVPIGSTDDGSQIWKITHNGVDTHPIHFHLYDVQLVNRVAWDGMIFMPDSNELGWKETVRVNPLMDTIVALRPILPTIPFQVPNSVRLIDPTMPEGAILFVEDEIFDTVGEPLIHPLNITDPETGLPVSVINHYVNFGFEYMMHCHILSHEEMDMMHSVVVAGKPDAPSDLTAIRSGNTVNLGWTDNSLNETHFTIERATDPAFTTGLTAFTVGENVTAYADTVTGNPTYFYRVSAGNTVGDTTQYLGDPEVVGFPTMTLDSEYSNTATIGVAVETPPAAPSNLTATLQTGPQVSLSWTDNANNETGFVIERSVGGGAFAELTSVGPRTGTGAVSYTDTTVAAGNEYSYRVKAVNAAGSSDYSNTAGVTIPAAPAVPNAPSNLAASARRIGNSQNARVALTWTDNSNNETGFAIQRSTNPGFTANVVNDTVRANVTSFETKNIPRNVTYWFRVRAYNANGTSAWSNVVSATTP